MPVAPPLDSQHILIIGAGPGLGAAIAHRFGREGFAVTLVARREQALAGLADDLRRAGVTAHLVAADASHPAALRASLQQAAQRTAPGVVVYNAALLARDGILTSEPDYLAAAYAVDVLGAVVAAQVLTPPMRQARAGTFLVTGGGLALSPDPDHASLSMGKAALRAATALLHEELKADRVHAAGVIVNGNIASGTPFAPELIADTFWALHVQDAAMWNAEHVFDGQ